jgi:hypothetical protein
MVENMRKNSSAFRALREEIAKPIPKDYPIWLYRRKCKHSLISF